MGPDPHYRRFEIALAAADRLTLPDRRRFVRLLAWWLGWAEDLSARVPYVYLDYRIWTSRWPTGRLSEVPADPYDADDEMTRT